MSNMKYTPPKYEKCGCCGQEKEVSPAVIRCDECFNHFSDVLEVEAFGEEKNEHLDFCSWSCLLKHLPKITSAYHVTLPGLDYDETKPGLTVGDFWRAVGEFKTIEL